MKCRVNIKHLSAFWGSSCEDMQDTGKDREDPADLKYEVFGAL